MRTVLLLLLCCCTRQSVFSQMSLADSVISKELLSKYVQALAHDSMRGRYTGSAGCEMAASFIEAEMRSIGLMPLYSGDSGYYHRYNIADHGNLIATSNVAAAIPGRVPGKYIIFSAHYDHVGDSANNGLYFYLNPHSKDLIYYGANDNASGVAAMLAIARYFKALACNDHTIIFIAFSGEEDGLLGSEAFAQSFRHMTDILQVVNLEMLGRATSVYKSLLVTEGINSHGFAKKLNSNLKIMEAPFNKKLFVVDQSIMQGFQRSDNYSFAVMGVPANTIMATEDIDPHYHRPSDEWKTLDYKLMTRFVKAIALACTPLVKQ